MWCGIDSDKLACIAGLGSNFKIADKEAEVLCNRAYTSCERQNKLSNEGCFAVAAPLGGPPALRARSTARTIGDAQRTANDMCVRTFGLIDLGVVEVHSWACTMDDIEHPDQLIFDLDPGDGIGWEFVAETALALRELLHGEGFDCWPKLTGGAGLHLMSPIERGLPHKEVHRYALSLAERIAARNPAKYTTLAGPSRRIGKLFIDHLRNGRGFTAIGVYSPRVRAGCPVAMPTTWLEIESGDRPETYRLLRVQSRVGAGLLNSRERLSLPGRS